MLNFGDTRLPERFWNHVVPEPNSGCWIWMARTIKGYGAFKAKNDRGQWVSMLAHRYAKAAVERLIDGLQLDHTCTTPCCVNPAHLDQVTNDENMRRRAARTTHCKNGHLKTPENSYWNQATRRDRGGKKYMHRACKRCVADAQNRYQKRKKDLAA